MFLLTSDIGLYNMTTWILVITLITSYSGSLTTIGNFKSEQECKQALKDLYVNTTSYKREGVCIKYSTF